jgi:type II secretory pathway pseudopilin PulG
MRTRRKQSAGMSLVEVLVALGMLGILIMATVSLTTAAYNTTRYNSDKQFATQKAISILEELKALAQTNQGTNPVLLDRYDDGNTVSPILTVQTGATAGDTLSGNTGSGSTWLYSRRITVQRVGQSGSAVRLVRVAVFKNENGGQRLVAEVSSVIRTISTIMPPTQVYDVYCVAIENVPGWWVYTANLIPFVQNAIDNLQSRNPGLQFRVHWVTKLGYGRDQEYRPFINSANPSTSDINSVYFYPGALPQDASNPPLLTQYYPSGSFRAHMNIDGNERNGYNAASNTYPYALADQYNNNMRYPDEKALFDLRASRPNPLPVPGYTPAEDPTTPTYRLLLDDMILHPGQYTNAILINLHGELFPFPPIRNYSDAAKDPETTALQNLRVVSHPERLAYDTTGTVAPGPAINLRVYAYEAPNKSIGNAAAATVPDTAAYLPATANTYFPTGSNGPITVVIKGLNVAANVSIQRLEGGTKQSTGASPTQDAYAWSAAPSVASGNRMYATASNIGSDTLISLYNTPFRAPYCASSACGASSTYNGQGLNTASYLYNMQYIPSPVEDFTTGTPTGFTTLLDDVGTGPKNTARWIITIPGANLPANGLVTFETRIGAPAVPGSLPTTGVLYPTRDEPANLSRTYAWRGTNLWLYGDGTDTNPPSLPFSERFQFQGDPRHDPYLDNKMVHSGYTAVALGNRSPIGMGYNVNFDDFHDPAGNFATTWTGYSYSTFGIKNNTTNNDDGFKTGSGTNFNFGAVEVDVQRMFQMVRASLTSSRAIYTTMTGFSYYYLGLGGEIGYDSANQFPNSIPVSSKPFSGASGAIVEQSITNDVDWGDPTSCAAAQGCGVKWIRQVGDTVNNAYWWAMPWLGELYPDFMYTTAVTGWRASGNLPTGTTTNSFRRVLRAQIDPTNDMVSGTRSFLLPAGTTFDIVGTPNANPNLRGIGAAGAKNAVRRLQTEGSTEFFWTGTASNTFHHIGSGTTGSLTGIGTDIADPTNGYNFPILNPIPNNRPFNINIGPSTDNPDSFLSTVYGNPAVTRQEGLFYQEASSGGPGSALISLRDPASNKVAFIAVNGLSPTGDTGTSFIANWSFLSLIHSYLTSGLYTDSTSCTACPYRVRQLPRVLITFPTVADDLNDVSQIAMTWSTTWRRWDGRAYTPAYAANFGESDALTYQFMYSPDNGVSWKCADGSAVDTVAYPLGTLHRTAGDPCVVPSPGTSLTLQTPAASFPMGNYVLRVEVYRSATNLQLHYAYHQFRAFIRRPS